MASESAGKMEKLPCVLVKKQRGEHLRQWLINHSLLNRNIKIQSKDEWLIFPIVNEVAEHEKKALMSLFENIRFEQHELEIKTSKKPADLTSALNSSIPEDLIQYIPKSFDIIGDLIVIEILDELEPFEVLIGRTILKLHPSTSSVFKKIGSVKGRHRLRYITLLAGSGKSVTIHKENNCRFELDIKEVYFSPRLATEHDRVCSLVKDGEIILDMFAGIGPFSILIVKRKQAHVDAVDINPIAVQYLKRNIMLNDVFNKIEVHEGDARNLLNTTIKRRFDRIIMNLPSKASEFLDVATDALKSGGIIHYYQFVPEVEYPAIFLESLRKRIGELGRKVGKVVNIRKVRAYAPYIWHVGVDILVL